MLKKILFSTLIFILCLASFYYYIIATNPDPQLLRKCLTTKMNKIDLCPQNPNYIKLELISGILVKTILMSEDYSFFYHHGFDISEIQKSIEENLEEGRFKRGGSTISQQLVKNVFFSKEKNLIRKLREAFVTYNMEKTLNKELILERYLNVIELGPNIFGVKQAAQYYFNKSVTDINLLEAAYLAHLLPSPIKYSRTFDEKTLTDFSRKRILILCKKLFSVNKISEGQFQAANDLIDEFPWLELTFKARSRLKGIFLEPAVPTYLEEEKSKTTKVQDDKKRSNPLPEDSNLEKPAVPTYLEEEKSKTTKVLDDTKRSNPLPEDSNLEKPAVPTYLEEEKSKTTKVLDDKKEPNPLPEDGDLEDKMTNSSEQEPK